MIDNKILCKIKKETIGISKAILMSVLIKCGPSVDFTWFLEGIFPSGGGQLFPPVISNKLKQSKEYLSK